MSFINKKRALGLTKASGKTTKKPRTRTQNTQLHLSRKSLLIAVLFCEIATNCSALINSIAHKKAAMYERF
jgi:hypothetical protein